MLGIQSDLGTYKIALFKKHELLSTLVLVDRVVVGNDALAINSRLCVSAWHDDMRVSGFITDNGGGGRAQ